MLESVFNHSNMRGFLSSVGGNDIFHQLEEIILYGHHLRLDWFYTKIVDLRVGIRNLGAAEAFRVCFAIDCRKKLKIKCGPIFGKNDRTLPISAEDMNKLFSHMEKFARNYDIKRNLKGLWPSDYDSVARKSCISIVKSPSPNSNSNSKEISIFFSYSHHDEQWRDKIEGHLSVLKRQKIITIWHDRKIVPGENVDCSIKEALSKADIILPLLSSHFLNSDYCYTKEMEEAISRCQEGKAHIVPIILKDCDWRHSPLGSILAVPRDGMPISRWPNEDAALFDVTNAIRRVVDVIKSKRAG
ncbi:MAG: toll/interleukin-1 receptor domain-containing protein [Acetobacter peroxydans]|nr:toll/interleukin-1 receptor domain-containing protein [Acetobacter peroxydans]